MTKIPSKSNKQKTSLKNSFLLSSWKLMSKIERSGSISQRQGSRIRIHTKMSWIATLALLIRIHMNHSFSSSGFESSFVQAQIQSFWLYNSVTGVLIKSSFRCWFQTVGTFIERLSKAVQRLYRSPFLYSFYIGHFFSEPGVSVWNDFIGMVWFGSETNQFESTTRLGIIF